MVEQTKERFEKEFMDRYYEWLSDLGTLSDDELTKKYGVGKPKSEVKDNMSSGLKIFRQYIFCGRYAHDWKVSGYDIEDIWKLKGNGFFKVRYDSSWYAAQTGRANFYYVDYETAKQIYKKYRR